MAEVNLQTAAAYIYVMSYTELKNKQDFEAFKSIMERDKSKNCTMEYIFHFYFHAISCSNI